MSKRDWLRWTPYLAVTTALILLIANMAIETFGRYVLLDQEWRYQNQYENYQTEKAADKIAKNCDITNIPVAAIARCLSEQVKTYIEKKHSDQDLQAQKYMAFWAQALFWLTCLTAIMSLVGVLLLIISLRQTRTAISDTRDIGEKQVRSYVGISPDIVGGSDFVVEGGIRFKVEFDAKNSGSSPALGYRYAAGLEIVASDYQATDTDMVLPASDGPVPYHYIAPSGTSGGVAAITIDDDEFNIETLYRQG